MITEKLFDTVLLKPAREGANTLLIVAGYASAAMATRHFESLKKINSGKVNIKLLVGMCPTDGLSLGTHKAFCKLVDEKLSDRFSCSYVEKPPAVHSKLYLWCNNNAPVISYAGSANYTQNAFSASQREILSECPPNSAMQYFKAIEGESILCTHQDAERAVNIHNNRHFKMRQDFEGTHDEEQSAQKFVGLPHIKLSLLTESGEIHDRSGLNWGQRSRRNPNQAYIPVPAEIAGSGFFPREKGTHFTVETDDDKILIFRSQQQNSKAITTPDGNHLMGTYFRRRLSLADGAYVTKDDLLKYGRTDVDFYKIDEETYYMDFSVPKQANIG